MGDNANLVPLGEAISNVEGSGSSKHSMHILKNEEQQKSREKGRGGSSSMPYSHFLTTEGRHLLRHKF